MAYRSWRAVASAFMLGAASLFSAPSQAAHDNICPGDRSFVGETVQTENRHITPFMMVSAYHLEPYSPAYLQNALSDLGRHNINGIVYGTLGATDFFFKQKGVQTTEAAMNSDIYRMARSLQAKIWLQVRMYDNQLAVDGVSPRNVTAEEIISSQAAMTAYLASLASVVRTYNDVFSDACVIVLFEEAGIYHAPQGGGTFWSSKKEPVGAHSALWDELFADHLVGLYRPAAALIKSINPKCRIGVHIGHSAMDNRVILSKAFDRMSVEGARPDFLFYDLYLKAQRDNATYKQVLKRRADFMRQDLQIVRMHLAQLQTMNHFQKGFAQTPSKEELDDIVATDEALGFNGIGFYTKNAVPTADFSNEPLAPNVEGQKTVYESSKDRWDYAILKLLELQGIDFRNLFDLLISYDGPASTSVEIRNVKTGLWTMLGTISSSATNSLSTFREIDARLFLENDRRLSIRVVPQANSVPGAYRITAVPSYPSQKFRSAASYQVETRGGITVGDARGVSVVELGPTPASANICVH